MNQNRILIVEDELIVARNLQKRLMNLRFDVPTIAATAAEAVQEAERTHPDLVLMDIRLEGDSDGIVAAREIHERLDIPVVFLTAYADPGTIRRAKTAQPLGLLPKPFGLRELQTTIEMALHKHSVDGQLRRRERWLDAALRSISDAVIATDLQGCVTFLNPAAEGLIATREEDAIGQSLADLPAVTWLAPDGSDLVETVAALREGRLADMNGDFRIRRTDGREMRVASRVAPIIDDGGRSIGIVLVLRDAPPGPGT